MSLSDYLRTTLETVARQLSPDELRERLAELDPVELPEGESAAEIIREMRGSI